MARGSASGWACSRAGRTGRRSDQERRPLRHDVGVLFAELAATSAAVRDTRSRKRKAELLGAALRQLGPGEIEPGVAFLSGELRQRRTGVGWAALREVPPPAAEPSLQIGEVDDAFARLAAL